MGGRRNCRGPAGARACRGGLRCSERVGVIGLVCFTLGDWGGGCWDFTFESVLSGVGPWGGRGTLGPGLPDPHTPRLGGGGGGVGLGEPVPAVSGLSWWRSKAGASQHGLCNSVAVVACSSSSHRTPQTPLWF